VAKLGGAKSHFWRPRPPLLFVGVRIYLITCPTQLRMFCEVIKKSYFDNSENQMTGTEDRKKLFRPPSRTPHSPHCQAQICCTPHKGASTGQVWPRCGPGKCPKNGVEIWGSPKKTPPFLGGSRKKRYHRVAGAEPHHLRWSRRNRPPGASAARTRKTT
jgi:hypothetical protein